MRVVVSIAWQPLVQMVGQATSITQVIIHMSHQEVEVAVEQERIVMIHVNSMELIHLDLQVVAVVLVETPILF